MTNLVEFCTRREFSVLIQNLNRYFTLLDGCQMITLFLQSDLFPAHRISGDMPQFDHIWNPVGGDLTLKLLQQLFEGLLSYFCPKKHLRKEF